MDKLLVIVHTSYEDEFDLEGFFITTEAYWEKYTAKVKAFYKEYPGKEIEDYFGTNEAMMFESAEDVLRCFKTRAISNEDAMQIKKLFSREALGYTGPDEEKFDIHPEEEDE